MDGISKWDNETAFFLIETPHALSQLAGYVKYCLSSDGPVFFRGQTSHYPTMYPSLFSPMKKSKQRLSPGTCIHRVTLSRNFIKEECQDAFLTNTPQEAQEAILQHYGLKTRWLDLVDNVWSALWFATHTAHTLKNDKYVHYEQNKEKFSYIYMLQFGKPEREVINGIHITGKGMQIADLRIAAPSTYLRPHSQHGVLAMRQDLRTGDGADYSDCVALVMQIDTEKALSWLGHSILVQDSFMFPSPKYDQGYQIFLEKQLLPPSILGCVSHIGA